MFKKRDYFIETLVYELAIVIISLLIMTPTCFLFHQLLQAQLVKDELNGFMQFYSNYSLWLYFLLLGVFLFFELALIQKMRFIQYRNYFVSGIAFLEGELSTLPPFHESLFEEREQFIRLRKNQLIMEERYENIYREKVDLLSYLAHDIKTPLAAAMGFLSVLSSENALTNEQKLNFIHIIEKNIKKIDYLSEDFFTYLKFSLQEIPIYLSEIDIVKFFEQWIDERQENLNQDISLKINRLENKCFRTDVDLFIRILDNLLNNAQDYSPKTGEINIQVEEYGEDLRLVMINEVSQGSKVDWSMAKNKFYRGDQARQSSNRRGSGLGLAIVEDLARHLKGKFNIKEIDGIVVAEIIFRR